MTGLNPKVKEVFHWSAFFVLAKFFVFLGKGINNMELDELLKSDRKLYDLEKEWGRRYIITVFGFNFTSLQKWLYKKHTNKDYYHNTLSQYRKLYNKMTNGGIRNTNIDLEVPQQGEPQNLEACL